jgi:hypothetical protein
MVQDKNLLQVTLYGLCIPFFALLLTTEVNIKKDAH